MQETERCEKYLMRKHPELSLRQMVSDLDTYLNEPEVFANQQHYNQPQQQGNMPNTARYSRKKVSTLAREDIP